MSPMHTASRSFTRMTLLMHITTARRRLSARALAILQTATAALAAWYLCILLLPDPQPVFACIATVISIGATHGAHVNNLIREEPTNYNTKTDPSHQRRVDATRERESV